jgi:nitrogen fixation NifU-like protein
VISGQRYAPITVDHFQHPRNIGRMADADGVGHISDPEHETSVTVYVKMEAGRIARASFRTFGCSACIAASSMATELLVGRAAANTLSADELDAALSGLPADKRYCAELVADAARQAVGSVHT